MIINVELSESDLRQLVLEHLREQTNFPLKKEDIKIEVKSQQNFKSEWEQAQFRATVIKNINLSV